MIFGARFRSFLFKRGETLQIRSYRQKQTPSEEPEQLKMVSPRLGKLTFELLWGLKPGRSSLATQAIFSVPISYCPYKPLCEKSQIQKKYE